MSLSKIKEIINNGLTMDIIRAGLACGIDLDDIEDAYQGTYSNDAEFAQQMSDDIGIVDPNIWPYSCINWVDAAEELMVDYVEDNGYYFHNI